MTKNKVSVMTVTVPFIPTIGADSIPIPPKPSDFDQYIDYEKHRYDLHEVEGTKWIFVDNEWVDCGWNARYLLNQSNNKGEK